MTGDGQTDSNEILGSHRDLVVAEEILRVFPSLDIETSQPSVLSGRPVLFFPGPPW